MKEHTVTENEAGQRLDRWFKRTMPGLPHSLLEKHLRKGLIRVDGKRAKSSDRLSAGQVVRMPQMDIPTVEPKRSYRPAADDATKLRRMVIYEDARMLVLNKPAGLAVQGGSGQTKHIDGMLAALAQKGERPLLVHRLDRDTSGVLVLAKNARVAAELGKMLAGKDMEKIYWALVRGVPKPREGKIDMPLSKSGGEMERMTVDAEEGKRAVTIYRVIETAGKACAWMQLEPVTGRTHQLRVHMAEIGYPIVGDGKYGCLSGDSAALGVEHKLHLHARRITIPPFAGGRKVTVEAPLPPHMRTSLVSLGFDAPKN